MTCFQIHRPQYFTTYTTSNTDTLVRFQPQAEKNFYIGPENLTPSSLSNTDSSQNNLKKTLPKI